MHRGGNLRGNYSVPLRVYHQNTCRRVKLPQVFRNAYLIRAPRQSIVAFHLGAVARSSLQPLHVIVDRICRLSVLRGWPAQARSWLEWGSSELGRVFLPYCVFRIVYFDSISTPSQPGLASQTAGPSSPRIIRFAMICSGRDDRIEKI